MEKRAAFIYTALSLSFATTVIVLHRPQSQIEAKHWEKFGFSILPNSNQLCISWAQTRFFDQTYKKTLTITACFAFSFTWEMFFKTQQAAKNQEHSLSDSGGAGSPLFETSLLEKPGRFPPAHSENPQVLAGHEHTGTIVDFVSGYISLLEVQPWWVSVGLSDNNFWFCPIYKVQVAIKGGGCDKNQRRDFHE